MPRRGGLSAEIQGRSDPAPPILLSGSTPAQFGTRDARRPGVFREHPVASGRPRGRRPRAPAVAGNWGVRNMAIVALSRETGGFKGPSLRKVGTGATRFRCDRGKPPPRQRHARLLHVREARRDANHLGLPGQGLGFPTRTGSRWSGKTARFGPSRRSIRSVRSSPSSALCPSRAGRPTATWPSTWRSIITLIVGRLTDRCSTSSFPGSKCGSPRAP